MEHKFGWGLPPGISNHMIEEQAGAFEESEMDAKDEQRMRLATRLENMGYQLHSPYGRWLVTHISPTFSLPTLDEVETLVERLEEAAVA